MPFTCTYRDCKKTCLRRADLTTHINTVHKNIKRFTCSSCGKTFYYKGHLNTHQQSHLPTKERKLPFQCDICEYSSNSSTHLKRHQEVHSPPNVYCSCCRKPIPFRSPMALRCHEQNILDQKATERAAPPSTAASSAAAASAAPPQQAARGAAFHPARFLSPPHLQTGSAVSRGTPPSGAASAAPPQQAARGAAFHPARFSPTPDLDIMPPWRLEPLSGDAASDSGSFSLPMRAPTPTINFYHTNFFRILLKLLKREYSHQFSHLADNALESQSTSAALSHDPFAYVSPYDRNVNTIIYLLDSLQRAYGVQITIFITGPQLSEEMHLVSPNPPHHSIPSLEIHLRYENGVYST